MSNYLEVNPKILEKNFLLNNDTSYDAENFEKFFRSTENYSTSNQPWKWATPIPGWCIKTLDDKKNKVFINLCQLDDIPEPKNIEESQLLNIWQSEEVSDYRVPLSIQEPHDELDKSGKPVIAYDVAINTKFFKKIQESTIFRSFILQVAFEGIENKFNITLKKEGFVILQNRKSLGELRPHRIRTQNGPYVPPKRLIEEVPTSELKHLPPRTDTESRRNICTIPNLRFYQNSSTKVLVAEFHLPKIGNSKDIVVDVGEDRLVIECKRNIYSADLFMPIQIDQDRVTAQFNKKNKVLTVFLPNVCSVP